MLRRLLSRKAKPRRLRVYRDGPAIGDQLMCALFAQILLDHGIEAVVDIRHGYLTDCPLFANLPEKEKKEYVDYRFSYEPPGDLSRSLMHQALEVFEETFPEYQGMEWQIRRSGVPLRYVSCPEIKGVDVVMNLVGGKWSNVRHYLRFEELKRLLDREGIPYIDLMAEGIRDFKAIDTVRKSKLYLGVESGVSHLMASLCNKANSLVAQSGYVSKEYWAAHYNYDFIESPQPCAPCGLRSVNDCPRNHACMEETTPELFLKEIKKKLGEL